MDLDGQTHIKNLTEHQRALRAQGIFVSLCFLLFTVFNTGSQGRNDSHFFWQLLNPTIYSLFTQVL